MWLASVMVSIESVVKISVGQVAEKTFSAILVSSYFVLVAFNCWF